MMNKEELKKFLVDSNKAGYAAGDERAWRKEANGSTTIEFAEGEWQIHDNFFGGEPYGGREVVFYQDKPVWTMVYYGWVIESVDINEVYKILREALTRQPEDHPFRGPREHINGVFAYRNEWTGEVERFSGREVIFKNGEVIYEASYMGGLVDTRRGV